MAAKKKTTEPDAVPFAGPAETVETEATQEETAPEAPPSDEAPPLGDLPVPRPQAPTGLAAQSASPEVIERLQDALDSLSSFNNIQLPMIRFKEGFRMLADEITLVIRGTKRADFKKMPAESGPTAGYELWFPLQEWSHADVFAYLKEVGAPICRVYENNVNAPECATCTAWWSENRARYLKRHHPALAAAYMAKLARVAREVAPFWTNMQSELADG